MPQVKHYIRAKVRWDKIPDEIVISYEKDIAALKAAGVSGRDFKVQSATIYNSYFAEFGYTKSLN